MRFHLVNYLYSKFLVFRLRQRERPMCEVITLSSRDSELTRLASIHGSDKGSLIEGDSTFRWPAHTYTAAYEWIFKLRRDSVSSVLECGVGTNNPEITSSMGISGTPGASLRMWRDYFPNAQVFGLDIDERILFEEERIKTFQVDQTNYQKVNSLLSTINIQFDLIVDDGLHTFEAGRTFFEAAFPWLAPRGTYAIEDVTEADALRYHEYFKGKSLDTHLLRLRRGKNLIGDNQMILITR